MTTTPPLFSLGRRIRELRLSKGITQIDLARGLCTPSMISQIESDRAKPSYKMLHALSERLSVPLEKLLADVELNLEFVSTYKMARAMSASRQYAAAIPLLRDLLRTPRAQVSTMEILHELGECLLHVGEYDEAEKLLTEVSEIATLRRDEHHLALSLKLLAQIEFEYRRYPLAVFLNEKALDALAKMTEPDIYLRAGLLYALGLAHAKAGDPGKALDAYREAASLYEGADNLYEIGHVYMSLGQSYKQLGDLERSVEYSDLAIGIFEGMENVLLTMRNQVTSAVLYGQSGRTAEAMQILQSVIPRFRQLSQHEEAGMALVELAKLRLDAGELDEAVSACTEARFLLPELHLYQAWINRTLAKVDLLRNDKKAAIRRFQSAADAFKLLDELDAWGDTLHELSCLYVEDNDYDAAFHLLDGVRSHTRHVLHQRGIVL